MLALINPGDEVVIFQPFYENYGPDALLSGAKPVWVTCSRPIGRFDPRRAAPGVLQRRRRAIIVNTPNNPTGKVFTRKELTLIAELCQEFDAYAITDEIYEHIIYTDTAAHQHRDAAGHGRAHGDDQRPVEDVQHAPAGGSAIASPPPQVTAGIRKVHDFLTVGAPHPLQVAATVAYSLPREYYTKLVRGLSPAAWHPPPYLREAGFQFHDPDGAYYVMTDISGLGGTRRRRVRAIGSSRRSAWPACRDRASITRPIAAEPKCDSCGPSRMRLCTKQAGDCRNWRH